MTKRAANELFRLTRRGLGVEQLRVELAEGRNPLSDKKTPMALYRAFEQQLGDGFSPAALRAELLALDWNVTAVRSEVSMASSIMREVLKPK